MDHFAQQGHWPVGILNPFSHPTELTNTLSVMHNKHSLALLRSTPPLPGVPLRSRSFLRQPSLFGIPFSRAICLQEEEAEKMQSKGGSCDERWSQGGLQGI